MQEDNKNVKLMYSIVIVQIAIVFLLYEVIMISVVSGDSMYPTLNSGDILVSIRKSEFKVGDIIIVENEKRGSLEQKYIVKRVIAVEGDRLRIDSGVVHLNGKPLPEPYLKEEWYSEYYYEEIPKGYVFVMGDNRNISIDSRNMGTIPIKQIKSRVIFDIRLFDK